MFVSDIHVCIQMESIVHMKVTEGGSVTGFVYWFTLHFLNGERISTGPGEVREGLCWC